MNRKGIILSGGLGTRLFPATISISKQIIPVYDKPMIYYSLSTLMQADIREILIISSPEHINFFKKLFNDGAHLGLRIDYMVQEKPEGIAQSFLIAEDFIGDSSVSLILGDNIFFSSSLEERLVEISKKDVSSIFAFHVKDPSAFGVVEFDKEFRAIGIEEKPEQPRSNYAVTGLYFYNNDVISVAKTLKKSGRGEYEITDVNKHYLDTGRLEVNILPKGSTWLDTGTPDNLLQASQFVAALEKREGRKIGCPEEISLKRKWINEELLEKYIFDKKGQYFDYLRELIKNGNY